MTTQDPTHPLHPEPAWARPSAAYRELHKDCRHGFDECVVPDRGEDIWPTAYEERWNGEGR